MCDLRHQGLRGLGVRVLSFCRGLGVSGSVGQALIAGMLRDSECKVCDCPAGLLESHLG